jgi:hypothetical protein
MALALTPTRGVYRKLDTVENCSWIGNCIQTALVLSLHPNRQLQLKINVTKGARELPGSATPTIVSAGLRTLRWSHSFGADDETLPPLWVQFVVALPVPN